MDEHELAGAAHCPVVHPFPYQPLSPCIHQQLFLNQPRLSPATLRGIRQGDISRFLCVCPVLLDLHFHFPCDAAPFLSHYSQLLIQPSLSLSASRSCLTTIALLTRHRLPESWQNNTPTVNKRRVAKLRLLSATSTSSDITLHFTSRLHSCTRHASCLSIPTTPTSPA